MPDIDVGTLFQQAAGHAARFRAELPQRLQRPELTYAEVLERLRAPLPETGAASAEVIEELVAQATPGLHASAGARFYGWVIGASHPVGVAADFLTSTWGQNAGNHTAAPAAAAVEAVAAEWLLDLLGLPGEASVGFVTGATVANFVCLAAARGAVLRRQGWDVEANGLFGAPPIEVVLGEEAHSTVFAALQLLGLGHDRVRRVATDAEGAMRPEALATALSDGSGPCIVVMQAGQLNTGAFDPFPALLPRARARGAWVHVDGAFGLWARACPARAALAAGVDGADSWATDGHKWLQTPYDCGYAIVRDAAAHRRAMTIAASYLPEVAAGERDPAHYVPELSRRARGFATWAMLRHLGRAGVAAMVERHCALASRLAEAFAGNDEIRVLNRVGLNQVVLRFGPDRPAADADRLTLAATAALQRAGTCFAGPAQWRGQWVLRISVIGFPTTEHDIDATAAAIRAAWNAVRGS